MKLSKFTIISWILTIIMPIIYFISSSKMDAEKASLTVKQLETSLDAVDKLNNYNMIENTLIGMIIGFIVLSIVLTILDFNKKN